MLRRITQLLATTHPSADDKFVSEEETIAIIVVFSPPRSRVARHLRRKLRAWRKRPSLAVDALCRLLMVATGAGEYAHVSTLIGGVAINADRSGITVQPESVYLAAVSRERPGLIGVDLDRPLRLSAVEWARRRCKPGIGASLLNRLSFGLWPMPPHCLGMTIAVLRAGGVAIPRRVTSIAALLRHLKDHHEQRTFDIPTPGEHRIAVPCAVCNPD